MLLVSAATDSVPSRQLWPDLTLQLMLLGVGEDGKLPRPNVKLVCVLSWLPHHSQFEEGVQNMALSRPLTQRFIQLIFRRKRSSFHLVRSQICLVVLNSHKKDIPTDTIYINLQLL